MTRYMQKEASYALQDAEAYLAKVGYQSPQDKIKVNKQKLEQAKRERRIRSASVEIKKDLESKTRRASDIMANL